MKRIILLLMAVALVTACDRTPKTETKGNDTMDSSITVNEVVTEPIVNEEPVNHVERAPLNSEEIQELIKLYLEDNAENKYNKLEKWCFVDIDNDGYDEAWLSSNDGVYGALFTIKDTPKLILTCDDHMSAQVYDGYVMKSGPAGGPAYYYQYCVLSGSEISKSMSLMEVYGNFDFASINGEDVEKEQAEEFLNSLSHEERELNLEWNRIE